MRVSLSEAPRATGAHGAHRPHLGAPSEQKERKGQEMDARGKHDFPFPNTGSLSLPLWVFVPFLAMKGLRNRVQDLGALCKATRTPLTPSSLPFHLRVAAAPRRFYSPLFSPSKSWWSSRRLHCASPSTHTFPSNPTSNRENPPRWRLAGNTTVGYSADTPVH